MNSENDLRTGRTPTTYRSQNHSGFPHLRISEQSEPAKAVGVFSIFPSDYQGVQFRHFALFSSCTRHQVHLLLHLFVLVLINCVPALAVAAEITLSADPRASAHTFPDAIELVRAELAAQTRSGRRETILVSIAPGHYRIQQPIVLNAGDSGTESAPIVFRGAAGGLVRISGAQRVTAQRGVSDPGIRAGIKATTMPRVWEASLPSSVKHSTDSRRPTGPIPFLVAANNQQLRLSRWPKVGYVEVSSAAKTGGAWEFSVLHPEPATWNNEVNLWAHGYWFYDWRDDHIPIALSRGASSKSFRALDAASPYGIKQGARIYFENVLHELASPGDMFVDSAKGKLYFVAPADNGQTPDLEVSALDNLLVVDGASFVRFENVTFEMSTQTAIRVKGGQAVAISNCTILRTGNTAVILDGQGHSISKCKIYESSSGGVTLSGGDRQTLRAGNVSATDNFIYGIGERLNTFAPAVTITGVGNTAARNDMRDLPNIAIHFSGNDHAIQANFISGVCRASDDAGAIYTGRDWTGQGTTVSDNVVVNSPGIATKLCIGVYLDDQASGVTVLRNIFHSIPRAVVVGGGRDIAISDNSCISVKRCINVDSRGERSGGKSEELRKALTKVPYDRSPYTKYPHLKDILSDSPESPRRITVTNNISIGTEQFIAADVSAAKAVTENANSTVSLADAVLVEPQLANISRIGELPTMHARLKLLRERLLKRAPK